MLIIDYDVGNLRNVQKLVGSLGQDSVISNSLDEIDNAPSYILPGVGAYSDAMKKLADTGLIDALRKNVLERKKPILGICLGMQLLGKASDEGAPVEGLNLLDMSVKKIHITDGFRLPHIGWNDINIERNSILMNGLPENPDFYFVHSYHAICADYSDVVATCQYSHKIVASVERGNIFGVQFHPEKSQAFGAHVVKNFIDYSRGL
jgi:imidazole glycerol-phosphate synthase subunit HisH